MSTLQPRPPRLSIAEKDEEVEALAEEVTVPEAEVEAPGPDVAVAGEEPNTDRASAADEVAAESAVRSVEVLLEQAAPGTSAEPATLPQVRLM